MQTIIKKRALLIVKKESNIFQTENTVRRAWRVKLKSKKNRKRVLKFLQKVTLFSNLQLLHLSQGLESHSLLFKKESDSTKNHKLVLTLIKKRVLTYSDCPKRVTPKTPFARLGESKRVL